MSATLNELLGDEGECIVLRERLSQIEASKAELLRSHNDLMRVAQRFENWLRAEIGGETHDDGERLATLPDIAQALARGAKFTEETDPEDRLVTVCSECLQASCWQGIFMCQEAQGAGIVEKTVRELRKMARENPCYWAETPGKEQP